MSTIYDAMATAELAAGTDRLLLRRSLHCFIGLGCRFTCSKKKWQLNVADQIGRQYSATHPRTTNYLTELADKNKQLEQQSTRDALTGVRNRAFFD